MPWKGMLSRAVYWLLVIYRKCKVAETLTCRFKYEWDIRVHGM